MKSIKKALIGLILGGLVISQAVCASAKSLDVLKGKEGVFAVLTTEKGEIVLNLFYKETPMTVANFVGLAEGTLDAAKGKPFYDGLKFHRVIANFMIQGGDPQGNGTGGPGYKFPDEFVEGLIFDKPGKLAMANSGVDTNGSQFFITHVPTEWLDYAHTIFGEVLAGQDVVNKVAQDDHIVKLEIIRQGKDAEKFVVNQEVFNKLKTEGAAKNEKWKANKAAVEKRKAEEKIKPLVVSFKKTNSGIYYNVLQKGKGGKVGKGKTITVEYRVYTIAGENTVFGATKAFHPRGGDPMVITTGKGDIIPGFDEMLQDMEVGETRKMYVPGDLAYGPMGGIPQYGIGAYDYIVFEAKIVK